MAKLQSPVSRPDVFSLIPFYSFVGTYWSKSDMEGEGMQSDLQNSEEVRSRKPKDEDGDAKHRQHSE